MREVYLQQSNPAFEAAMAARTAAREAQFFTPYLRSGMALLDAGCGPGSITLGLAEHVTPGPVVGVDIQPAQVEQARTFAAARGATGVRFEAADLYRLPFPDRSFDAVFANGVLMHLREPMRALAELRRVLRPGGTAGIRDPDFSTNVFFPVTPVLEQWFALRLRTRRHNGNDPTLSRSYRRLLLDAGFTWSEAGASVDSAGTPTEIRRHGAFLLAQLQGLSRTALAQGWTDQPTVDAIAAEIEAWMQRSDAFCAMTWCHAVGR